MELTQQQWDALMEQINKAVSGIQTLAIGVRTYRPHYYAITGPATGTIPDKVKAYNIINLGLGGNNKVFDDIAVTGIIGTTSISKHIRVLGYKVDNDQNILSSPIVVTPETGHVVVIQYLIT